MGNSRCQYTKFMSNRLNLFKQERKKILAGSRWVIIQSFSQVSSKWAALGSAQVFLTHSLLVQKKERTPKWQAINWERRPCASCFPAPSRSVWEESVFSAVSTLFGLGWFNPSYKKPCEQIFFTSVFSSLMQRKSSSWGANSCYLTREWW